MPLNLCIACGGSRLKEVANLGESPVLTGAVFDDRDSARQAVCGVLQLSVCLDCSHVQNVAFDPSLVQYDASYDNSLHFSGTFQHYADELARHLVDHYRIRGEHIVEIGSGKGDFLKSICELGANTGTGYDPTSEADTRIPSVELVQDYFRPGDDIESYDLLVCRHVLEHLDDPAALLRSLADNAPPEALYYFEVPAAEFNFSPRGLWDCIYPHVSYFSQASLPELVTRSGFDVLSLRPSFHGQFLSLYARFASGNTATADPTPEHHLALVAGFADRYRNAVNRWRAHVARSRLQGEVAVWGIGSKGVNFLHAVDPVVQLIAVDVNTRKWGRYIPLTGHEVVAPATLAGRNISTVAVMNAAYRDEIAHALDEFRIDAEIIVN